LSNNTFAAQRRSEGRIKTDERTRSAERTKKARKEYSVMGRQVLIQVSEGDVLVSDSVARTCC